MSTTARFHLPAEMGMRACVSTPASTASVAVDEPDNSMIRADAACSLNSHKLALLTLHSTLVLNNAA